jgi:hypothetical protein
MASRGTTFAKQDRDRAKKAKAALKRERRLETPEEGEEPVEAPAPVDHESNERIMEQVAELHRLYDDKQIDFDEFDERKAELMARITV